MVLKSIIIDLNNVTSCDGILSVNDNLNPAQDNTALANISDYFDHNPIISENLNLGYTMQYEADNISIYTGSYFIINFNETRFEGNNLKYSLRNSDESRDTYWLNLNGLSLSGIPPERFWPWSYDIQIVASDQFYEYPISVTLHVVWGFGYVSKLLGELLIPFTIWLYLNIIMNIFFKKYYQYPKSFTIRVGQDISECNILPMAFIGAEAKEAKLITKEITKYVAKSLGKRSVSKSQLVEYFINSMTQRIDQDKLIQVTDDTIANLSATNHAKVKYYTQANGSRKILINQLILNGITLEQLDLKHERLTQEAFEKVKDDWIVFLEHDSGSPGWQLSINQEKLEHYLLEKGVEASTRSHRHFTKTMELIPRTSMRKEITPQATDSNVTNSLGDTSLHSTDRSLNAGLIKENQNSDRSQSEPKINMVLLTDALIAYAYKKHHLNIGMENLSIVSKEHIKDPWLPRLIANFLKLDLKPVLCALGNEIGYGLRFKVEDDVLHFSGTANNYVEGRRLVIQIHQNPRIVREIWLTGLANDLEEEPLLGHSML